jgi:hypothetical protein
MLLCTSWQPSCRYTHTGKQLDLHACNQDIGARQHNLMHIDVPQVGECLGECGQYRSTPRIIHELLPQKHLLCNSCNSLCVVSGRGKHFNLAARTHGPTRSVDTLTVSQIWSLKNDSGNRSLHAKLIASLAEKPSQLAVQVGVSLEKFWEWV